MSMVDALYMSIVLLLFCNLHLVRLVRIKRQSNSSLSEIISRQGRIIKNSEAIICLQKQQVASFEKTLESCKELNETQRLYIDELEGDNI
jgi:hypothetical protein